MAEAKLNFEALISLVPILIRPGDTVLIPADPRSTQAQVHEAKTNLEAQFPGVTFQFVGSHMTHALIYRPEDNPQISPMGRTVNRALRRDT